MYEDGTAFDTFSSASLYSYCVSISFKGVMAPPFPTLVFLLIMTSLLQRAFVGSASLNSARQRSFAPGAQPGGGSRKQEPAMPSIWPAFMKKRFTSCIRRSARQFDICAHLDALIRRKRSRHANLQMPSS